LPCITLPRVVVEELERRAAERGVSVEELLLDLLGGDGGAELYARAAEEFVEEARHMLSEGDLGQAAQRLWVAAAMAVKAHALARDGKVLSSQAELWEYKDEVARELGGWVRQAFIQAYALRSAPSEAITRGDVEEVLRDIEALVRRMTAALSRPAGSGGGQP